jgi:hypothetical protein
MLKTKSGGVQKSAKSAKSARESEQEVRDLRCEDIGFKLANHAVPCLRQAGVFLQCRQKMLKTKSGSVQKRAKRAKESKESKRAQRESTAIVWPFSGGLLPVWEPGRG